MNPIAPQQSSEPHRPRHCSCGRKAPSNCCSAATCCSDGCMEMTCQEQRCSAFYQTRLWIYWLRVCIMPPYATAWDLHYRKNNNKFKKRTSTTYQLCLLEEEKTHTLIQSLTFFLMLRRRQYSWTCLYNCLQDTPTGMLLLLLIK